MTVSCDSRASMLARIWAYGLALTSVAIALLITRSLQPTVFPTPLFFAAIVVSTWFGSTGAGLLAVLLATALLEYYFVSPDRTLSVHPAAVLYLAQFLLPALLTCWFVKKRKEAEAGLKDARDQLDAKVQHRTAELRRSNEQLQLQIVERKRAEEAFHKTQADLAHLTRITTINALASSIAHEVNQPLAAIVATGDACLRWLAAVPPNIERAKDSVSRIVSEGSRAGEVVRRIRSLSKKGMPHKSSLQLNDVIQDVIALLETELEKNKIVLKRDLEDDRLLVFGDQVQLQQVILNLMVNAVESMSEVETQYRILTVRSERLRTDRLRVSIRDYGRGFDAKYPARLFETFFTTKPDGIGMGLSISRTIVEAHGGQLSASVNPDQGATFQFELPAVNGSES
jgi:C4-dicarboxylate-specific signal transduction histidine kinase